MATLALFAYSGLVSPVKSNVSLVIRLVVVGILTDLVSLIVGREMNGWDGVARR